MTETQQKCPFNEDTDVDPDTIALNEPCPVCGDYGYRWLPHGNCTYKGDADE